VAPVPAEVVTGVVPLGETGVGGVVGCRHPAMKRTIARAMQTTMIGAIFFIPENVYLSIFKDSF
jgi:hypothetical protein